MATELDDLRLAVRDAVDSLGGPALCRDLDPDGPGWDARAWSVLAEQIGVAAIGIPETLGGLGGLAELVVVAEELGAGLLPVPFLSTALAAQVLIRSGGADDALEQIAEGAPAALLGLDRHGWYDPDAIPFEIESGTAGATVSGVVASALGAARARWFVVPAHTPDGPALFLCDATHPGVSATPLPTLDLSRAHAAVTLSEVPVRRLDSVGSPEDVILPALDAACIVLAAEQVGGAQRILDRTVDYVKERRQFDRAIGSFQAVKHTLADLLVLVESSRSAVTRAVDADDLAEASSLARAWCSDAYRTVSAEALQLHGGIGFTWEHDCQLYFRRARADAQLLGTSTFHRERLAVTLGW
ncbi:acyl-CoA dehydrogenase family protein [Gordonia sp. SCSIO 19800]|uniref:acyl-CoA dehydrogenase family protein n=1 Tax=Gordonia sp. SCSIO 19800 TaxID=2826926 RepID=UPI001B8275F6|nr:acyl-CoA dehydrogenase [Gordonia sp. SCSIO 19800]MBR7194801.1 acyl-CoA dehydrogenase [Gordonia sp. SCSIO 19800]